MAHIKINDITPRIQYVATSLQTVFSIPFPFFENDDITVYRGTSETPISSSEYVITGAGTDSGGVLTMVSGETLGAVITIVRDSEIKRLTDFTDGGEWAADAVNTQLDRQITFIQEVRQLFRRCILLPVTSTLASLTFPSFSIADATKSLVINATGDGLDLGPTTAQIAGAAAAAANAAASAAAAAALAAALSGTSATSNSIGTGAKNFTTQANKAFNAGFVFVASASAPTNYMEGQITSYNPTTGALAISVAGGATNGTGTFTDWVIQVTGIQGIQGSAGAPGSIPVATAAGTVDAITANFTPDITLANLTLVGVVSLGPNTITNPAFVPDGLTSRILTARGGSALALGDTGPAGYFMFLEYNLANTRWELANPCRTIANDIYSSSAPAGAPLIANGSGLAAWGAKLITAAAAAVAGAFFNLPHGVAPTSPVDGDVWTTTAGLFVRINGATIGPLSSGGAVLISSQTASGATTTIDFTGLSTAFSYYYIDCINWKGDGTTGLSSYLCARLSQGAGFITTDNYNCAGFKETNGASVTTNNPIAGAFNNAQSSSYYSAFMAMFGDAIGAAAYTNGRIIIHHKGVGTEKRFVEFDLAVDRITMGANQIYRYKGMFEINAATNLDGIQLFGTNFTGSPSLNKFLPGGTFNLYGVV